MLSNKSFDVITDYHKPFFLPAFFKLLSKLGVVKRRYIDSEYTSVSKAGEDEYIVVDIEVQQSKFMFNAIYHFFPTFTATFLKEEEYYEIGGKRLFTSKNRVSAVGEKLEVRGNLNIVYLRERGVWGIHILKPESLNVFSPEKKGVCKVIEEQREITLDFHSLLRYSKSFNLKNHGGDLNECMKELERELKNTWEMSKTVRSILYKYNIELGFRRR